MLPSTFKYKSTEAEKIRQRVKAKLEMTRFLQETLHHTTGAVSEGEKSPSFEQFQGFLKKVQESLDNFVRMKKLPVSSKLFANQITLDSLELKSVEDALSAFSLAHNGPSNATQISIYKCTCVQLESGRSLAGLKEGVNTIPAWELQTLCQE
ncbi:LETM1 and EF-hand domain-containing protein 1 mitochondrial [Fasciola gigantica]|uniref:LETM1 and EF-hand domain-containing protein 1 mitochondrial n=1 Tax=Fasciola gigantica TaxID=46835 RepID=A0A504ZC01_FASGI|nr:LETM1 and EF-hand domain-containing protein 1 mitochondrial [Fasciola gigantica]